MVLMIVTEHGLAIIWHDRTIGCNLTMTGLKAIGIEIFKKYPLVFPFFKIWCQTQLTPVIVNF